MNRQAKTAIKSLVLTLRHKLEDEIEIQLKRYGLSGERWLPLERLPHIQRDDGATIEHFRLKAALEQHLRRIGTETDEATAEQRAEAAGWFVREVAFTHLNRLVALKCLEVRELIPEIITARDAYGGRSQAHYDYRNAHPDEANRPDGALLAAIKHASRQVYAEFKFLFDVGDPTTGRQPPAEAILWPSYPVLKECIALINDLDETAGRGVGSPAPDGRDDPASTLWAEDEIIGWFYQFYNAEHKEAVRKRGRPRRPAEVAVINQFFTPRWIVKFLVDNTLGRLWLEMHPDSERVRKKCDYLVPEPLSAEGDQITLDPDSPINDPKAPPRREAKRPQDLRLIDPACGTMHFGHYAFEVFYEIYRDARERDWVTGDDALPDEEIPASILRHNLYGVDIDLRAVQLAGLSLFMKAKTANPKAHISRVNLVVADAVLPADGARQQFLDQYRDDKVVQEAVRQVLDEMANVAEVGSLLRVEQRLRDILGRAGHAAAGEWDARQQRKLPGFRPTARQLSLVDVPGVSPEGWGAQYTLARLLSDLRDFAARALQINDLNALLFAQEAEKTIHLLDVFLNDYDVVLMNPPFGDTLSEAGKRLKQQYPNSYKNLLCAFLDRGISLVSNRSGFVGAIVDKSVTLRSTYADFRSEVLLASNSLLSMLDLGWGVLDDANVETVSLILKTDTKDGLSTFLRVTDVVAERKESWLQHILDDLGRSRAPDDFFVINANEFVAFPNKALSYWVPTPVRKLYAKHPALHPNVVTATEGIKPAEAARFIRFWWEIDTRQIGGRGMKWSPVSNGGYYSPFYRTVTQVILYQNDGEAIKNHRNAKGQKSSRTTGEGFYYQSGITYGKRTRILSVQRLEAHHLFTNEGHAIFPSDPQDTWQLIAILNSKLLQLAINTLCGQHKAVGYVRLLPYCGPTQEVSSELGREAEDGYDIKVSWDAGNELCSFFEMPWLIQAHRGDLPPGIGDLNTTWSTENRVQSIVPLLDLVQVAESTLNRRLHELQTRIDELVFDQYGISGKDRTIIERELGQRPPELVWPQMQRKSDKEKRREHVRRLLSYFILEALKDRRDGIIPLTFGTGHPTVLNVVRGGLEVEFGEELAFQLEADIEPILGLDIQSWLDRDFWKWHCGLFQGCPPVWQLASPDDHFGCILHIHKLDEDTLRKVQTRYLWNARRSAQSELESAKDAQKRGESGASSRVDRGETILEDLAQFERRLLSVVQAQVECDIPDWAEGPFRGGVYDPVLDDGVKVNITPLQEAGVLRYKKVV